MKTVVCSSVADNGIYWPSLCTLTATLTTVVQPSMPLGSLVDCLPAKRESVSCHVPPRPLKENKPRMPWREECAPGAVSASQARV